MEYSIQNGEILIERSGELIRVTACGRNAIRFQAFPGCRVVDTDYSLSPKPTVSEISDDERSVRMKNGTMEVVIDKGGCVAFYVDGKSAPVGVDSTEITEGSVYSFKAE